MTSGSDIRNFGLEKIQADNGVFLPSSLICSFKRSPFWVDLFLYISLYLTYIDNKVLDFYSNDL